MCLYLFFLEFESNWMKIIKERLKRNCESSVTKYSQKIFERWSIDSRKNGLIMKNDKASHQEDLSQKLPIVHQFKPQSKLEDCSNLVANKLLEKINCVPLTMILLESKDRKDKLLECAKENKNDTRQEWPGVTEIMESYRRFSKGRSAVAYIL